MHTPEEEQTHGFYQTGQIGKNTGFVTKEPQENHDFLYGGQFCLRIHIAAKDIVNESAGGIRIRSL